MTEIRFYHMTRSPVEKTLPDLLERTMQRGLKSLVFVKDYEAVSALSATLWAYRADGFLPHGMDGDDPPEAHPIWITARDYNPNGATVLFVLDGRTVEKCEAFDLVCDLFDGTDESQVEAARQRWGAYKKSGGTLVYWQQTEKGWTNKG